MKLSSSSVSTFTFGDSFIRMFLSKKKLAVHRYEYVADESSVLILEIS